MKLVDEVYLNVAKELSRLSKDENTKVGCIIVDSSGREVSSGRNGTVSGFDDSYIPMTREEKTLEYVEDYTTQSVTASKYAFMIHAEVNSLTHATDPQRLVGATLYCTHFPCSKCALQIAQHKIARVVIPSDGYLAKCVDETDQKITKFIFSQKCIQFQIGDESINLSKFRKEPKTYLEEMNDQGLMPC